MPYRGLSSQTWNHQHNYYAQTCSLPLFRSSPLCCSLSSYQLSSIPIPISDVLSHIYLFFRSFVALSFSFLCLFSSLFMNLPSSPSIGPLLLLSSPSIICLCYLFSSQTVFHATLSNLRWTASRGSWQYATQHRRRKIRWCYHTEGNGASTYLSIVAVDLSASLTLSGYDGSWYSLAIHELYVGSITAVIIICIIDKLFGYMVCGQRLWFSLFTRPHITIVRLSYNMYMTWVPAHLDQMECWPLWVWTCECGNQSETVNNRVNDTLYAHVLINESCCTVHTPPDARCEWKRSRRANYSETKSMEQGQRLLAFRHSPAAGYVPVLVLHWAWRMPTPP